MNKYWKRKKVRYGQDPNIYYCGKWKMAKCYYNAMRSRGDEDETFAIYFFIPGLKNTYAKTEKEAKEYIERATDYWLKGLEKEGNYA